MRLPVGEAGQSWSLRYWQRKVRKGFASVSHRINGPSPVSVGMSPLVMSQAGYE